jgi:hypothetical protein
LNPELSPGAEHALKVSLGVALACASLLHFGRTCSFRRRKSTQERALEFRGSPQKELARGNIGKVFS